MSPRSRRALLATATATAVGALAGCSALSSKPSADRPPESNSLSGTSVFLAPGVEFPDGTAAETVTNRAAADVAVYPSGDGSVAPVADALAADTPVAVAGSDAQWTLMRACADDGRSYGFARDSWGPETRVVAADPFDDRIDTHLFVGATLPRDLPWALGEALGSTVAPDDCTAPVESPLVPADASLVGASRIRGRNDVAGFDRWDRVWTVRGSTPAVFVAERQGRIFGGDAAANDGRYRADGVTLVTEFDAGFDAVGPAAGERNGLSIGNESDPIENEARHAFATTTDATRESFTACQRSRVVVDAFEAPFSYVGNGRFAWRDLRLLDDDVWNHHTPGRAVWYP